MLDVLAKIKNKERLTQNEIAQITWTYNEVHSESDGSGRWSEFLTEVYDTEIGLVAISYDKGLTEMQENDYHTQPYLVEIKEEEVTVIKKVIVPIGDSNE